MHSASNDQRTENISRLFELDSLRGIAALIVCLHHAVGALNVDRQSTLQWIAYRLSQKLLDGAAAVDVFFVLSGFVLALPFVCTSGVRLNSIEFVIRRFFRILPTHLLILAAVLVCRALLVSGLQNSGLKPSAAHYWDTPSDIANNLRLSVLALGGDTSINGPLWSLVVEMQASVLLPFFIVWMATEKSFLNSLFAVCLTAVGQFVSEEHNSAVFFPLFALGVWLAKWKGVLCAKLAILPRWTGTLFMSGSILLLWNRGLIGWKPLSVPPEYISALGAAYIIMAAQTSSQLRMLLKTNVLQFFGAISFPFYLLHYPAILAFASVGSGVFPPAFLVASSLIFSIVVSFAIHKCVELPFNQVGRAVAKRVRAQIDLHGEFPVAERDFADTREKK